MKKYIFAFVLFLFPTILSKWVLLLFGRGKYKIGNKARVGFSILLINHLEISEGVKIGHLNFIACNGLSIGKNTQFRHINFAKGKFDIIIGNSVWFNHSNKFSKLYTGETTNTLTKIDIGEWASINTKIIFDLSNNINIGKGTVLAGSGTQIWTHSFYKSRNDISKSLKVSKPVSIGDNCYIGSNCGIMPGVSISAGITIGSMTCIAKNLVIPGLYVNQPIRFVEFNPDEKIQIMEKVNCMSLE